MRLYETGFLISPNLSEEDTEKIILQMAEVISQKNGTMVKQERWGKRKMAYPVKKLKEAFYVFFQYEGEPDIPLELERRFRQTDTIIRYLTLKKETQEEVRRKKKKESEDEKKEASAGDAHLTEKSALSEETKGEVK